ncbi:MAG: CNNM domain-containing protein [Elusimicrobiota bacterium]|jgi:CBS domain containing-hemolysin-like protein/mannitol/fructose-specific phosphotransferase system IIA component
MFTLLMVCLLLIAGNAFFVLMEFALVRIRASSIEVLARKGNANAVRVQGMLSRLDDYLAASQVGITVISLALGWIGEPALAKWLDAGLLSLGLDLPRNILHLAAFGSALGLLSLAHIVLGELVPRAIGIQQAEVVALWGAGIMGVYARIIRPVISFMTWLSVSILRMLGFKSAAETENVVSEEEMRVLLGETQERGSFPLERLILLENLFDLGAAKVADAMAPVDKIAFLSLQKTWAENMEVVRLRRFSRYPLCETDLSSVLGMVHIKDFVLKLVAGPNPDLRQFRRELVEVPEGESLEKLVKIFPDKGTHMALVRNGEGKVAGLITLEDIMEELVGEVNDEFDLPQAWSLADLVVGPAVAVGLQASDRKAAVALLLSKLKAVCPEINEEEALKLVMGREAKLSSAVGRGAAVPHARLANIARPLIAVGRFFKPIACPSPDNIPVRLVFLILTPAGAPIAQLKILSRIAALLTNENLRRKLMRAKSGEALLETLRTADTLLAA